MLTAAKAKPFVMRVADFHLLLFLAAGHLDAHDMGLLCAAVRELEPVPEGYAMLINALAGIE